MQCDARLSPERQQIPLRRSEHDDRDIIRSADPESPFRDLRVEFGAGVDDDVFVTAAAGVSVSAFNDGKFAGGRRADGTFPKLCIPCLRGAAFF